MSPIDPTPIALSLAMETQGVTGKSTNSGNEFCSKSEFDMVDQSRQAATNDDQANAMTDHRIPVTVEAILQNYGALISALEVSRLLGYRTVGALHQARRRGHLGLALHRIPGRRGLFAFTEDVVSWLDELRATGRANEIALRDA